MKIYLFKVDRDPDRKYRFVIYAREITSPFWRVIEGGFLSRKHAEERASEYRQEQGEVSERAAGWDASR